jgi:hypothetical protein
MGNNSVHFDLRQVGGFLTNRTEHHDITEILLKMALNTITPTKNKRTIYI